MEILSSQNNKTTLKNKFGELTDFKGYLEAEVITTKWY